MEDLQHAGHEVVEPDHRRQQRLAAREGLKLRGQVGGATRRGHGVGDAFLQGDIGPALRLAELEIAEDDGQQVVEVVRDAASELAEAFELLRLHEALRHVALGHHASEVHRRGLDQVTLLLRERRSALRVGLVVECDLELAQGLAIGHDRMGQPAPTVAVTGGFEFLPA